MDNIEPKLEKASDLKPPADPRTEVIPAAEPAPKPTVGEIRSVRTHCPYRQSSLLQQALASDKMRVAFLLGAGCPMSINVDTTGGYTPLIPDVKGLTQAVVESLSTPESYKDSFQIVLARMKQTQEKPPNVEEILSFVRALGELAGTSGFEGLTSDILRALDGEICRVTTEKMQVRLSEDNTPYHQLATWISSLVRTHPVEVFTCNYDLLMEQALEERRVPYFDGFVGADKTFFDLPSIEQNHLPSRWCRLWKVHGSINWWRTSTGEFQRRERSESGDQQMIYPSHLKYLESRRMPYLAMLDRLKAFLAHDQAVLVTCGYSFADFHVNEVIFQGLSGNPMAICFGLIFGDLDTAPEAASNARKHGNLRLLAVDGAVLGSVEGDWISKESPEHPLHRIAVQSGEFASRTGAPAERCKFLLGDFASLGGFLAHQIANGEELEASHGY